MTKAPLNIITADDHPLLLKGLNDFLREKNYTISHSANDGKKALEIIKKFTPDIAILDIEMPELTGLQVAAKCKELKIPTKIIIITLHKEPSLYLKAQELNIFGYILKEFAIEEIVTCIQTVSKGVPYFSPSITQYINKADLKNDLLALLTPSEVKILGLIAKDKTNKDIAQLLFISYRTVEKHRSNIIQKLKLEPKTNSLLLWAKEHHARLTKKYV
jgi:DNA-binding NarL/FixJ family response regulator